MLAFESWGLSSAPAHSGDHIWSHIDQVESENSLSIDDSLWSVERGEYSIAARSTKAVL